jgi:hypothetical protein
LIHLARLTGFNAAAMAADILMQVGVEGVEAFDADLWHQLPEPVQDALLQQVGAWPDSPR